MPDQGIPGYAVNSGAAPGSYAGSPSIRQYMQQYSPTQMGQVEGMEGYSKANPNASYNDIQRYFSSAVNPTGPGGDSMRAGQATMDQQARDIAAQGTTRATMANAGIGGGRGSSAPHPQSTNPYAQTSNDPTATLNYFAGLPNDAARNNFLHSGPGGLNLSNNLMGGQQTYNGMSTGAYKDWLNSTTNNNTTSWMNPNDWSGAPGVTQSRDTEAAGNGSPVNYPTAATGDNFGPNAGAQFGGQNPSGQTGLNPEFGGGANSAVNNLGSWNPNWLPDSGQGRTGDQAGTYNGQATQGNSGPGTLTGRYNYGQAGGAPQGSGTGSGGTIPGGQYSSGVPYSGTPGTAMPVNSNQGNIVGSTMMQNPTRRQRTTPSYFTNPNQFRPVGR